MHVISRISVCVPCASACASVSCGELKVHTCPRSRHEEEGGIMHVSCMSACVPTQGCVHVDFTASAALTFPVTQVYYV